MKSPKVIKTKTGVIVKLSIAEVLKWGWVLAIENPAFFDLPTAP